MIEIVVENGIYLLSRSVRLLFQVHQTHHGNRIAELVSRLSGTITREM
jgi:hypothetical protein